MSWQQILARQGETDDLKCKHLREMVMDSREASCFVD